MRWLIEMVQGSDGVPVADLDPDYARPVLVVDRRDGAHDLIAAAYSETGWDGRPVNGEVYRITLLHDGGVREYVVTESARDGMFKVAPR